MTAELVAFARSEFKLNATPEGAEGTLRSHLQRVYDQTGIVPSQLAEALEIPDSTADIWQNYQAVSMYREYGEFGPKLITPTGIRDWCWVTGVNLSSWEKQIILRLDIEFMASRAK